MNNVKCVRHAPLYILHYFPSHTWLPYITLNGVRLAREISLIKLSNLMQNIFMDFEHPTPKGVYLWQFKKIIIHEHLWLIDGHF